MIAMKRLKRGFAASLALATVFTGVGMSAPADSGVVAAASASNTGSVTLSHRIITPEARTANRLLTNATVRITAFPRITEPSASSAAEIRLPQGLYLDAIPAHCGPESTLNNVDEPNRNTPVTRDSWKSLEAQTLVCDLGETGRGYANQNVWVDVRVRPELPPNHVFTVEAAVIAEDAELATASYDEMPSVYSKAEIAMGPHIGIQTNSSWPTTAYANQWPRQTARPELHSHPETETAAYWRANHAFVLTTPSQFGNQPLDWSKSEISFDMKPSEVYWPGVTNTKPWRDRQAAHGDAYQYYMPHLFISTTRPTAFSTVDGRNPLEAFRGGSSDLAFEQDISGQKATIKASHIDTSAWTVPIRGGAGDNNPLPHKAGNYNGPAYEMLYSRHVMVYTPNQAVTDLMRYSPQANRLPVTLDEPNYKFVGLHETNRPWINQSSWSRTGLGRADGHIEARHHISAPWRSSPLNTPGVVFSPGFPSYWEGLPGQESLGDGKGQVQYGETFMFSSSNRIAAPLDGASAQFQCLTWSNTLSLKDPGNEFHPAQGSPHHAQRYPSTGPVYISGQSGPKDFKDIKFQVQYSNGRPSPGDELDCANDTRDPVTGEVARWYSSPQAVPGNDPAKMSEGVYTHARSVRFVLATDVPTRWDLQVQVPLTPRSPATSRGGVEAWAYNSRSSINYNTLTFDSLSDIALTRFFHEPDFRSTATYERVAVSGRAEMVTMGTPLSMVEMDVQSPVRGGELGRVTVKPFSKQTAGPLNVRVNFDDSMSYYRTVDGPQPHTVNANSLIYRFDNPSQAEEIVIDMLTTPQLLGATGQISATSRVPGETSRRNNNASASMAIQSSTPTGASLMANQDNVDAHPFREPSQTNTWSMRFENAAPYHQAEVTAYVLMPRQGLADNIFERDDADIVMGQPLTNNEWLVRSSNQAFSRTASPAQLAAATYDRFPDDRTPIETVRLTRTIAPGAFGTFELPLLTQMTSDGDKITPHMIYTVTLVADGRDALTFNGATRAGQANLSTNVQGGTITGTAWVDGSVADHDGVMQSAGRQGVPNLPVTVTGTSDTGLAVDRSTTTASDGSWTVPSVPGGTYEVEFADEEWMEDSDFTTFTRLGDDSVVGYDGDWTEEFDGANHSNTAMVTVPPSGTADRTVTANAGLIGDSGITVERDTSHDYGYRGQDYVTSFTVTNDSDTFVDDVEVFDHLAPENIVGRSAAEVTSGPGAVANVGGGTTYTVDRLDAGESAEIRVTHNVSEDTAEGDTLETTTTAEGFFYGYDAEVNEPADHTGEIAVPVISSDMSWTDSGSWLPSISDPLTGWQTGTDAASDAVLIEAHEGERIADDEAADMFGPGESLESTYTITNESEVVAISVRDLLASMTGAELDEDASFEDRILEPGESVELDADFVSSMAQIEVDQDEAEADLDMTAIAPRYEGNFTDEVRNLDDEITNAFDWSAWDVPFHRYSDLVLQGSARDASGDGVIEADEEGQFNYTWVNKGNLTLTDVRFLDEATGDQPRFEGGYDGVLSPGEQVRGQTTMSINASLFNSDGIFSNLARSQASAPLSSDEDPEARTTTTLSQRSESGLDLSIELVDGNDDGSVSLGEEFSYEMLLRNNSGERFTDVDMDGPVEVTSGDVTYSLDVTFPDSFDGTMRPGDSVGPLSATVTATETASAAGYVDLEAGLLMAQARAEGVDSSGDTYTSNWASDTASVFAEPLTVAAGDGAGANAEQAGVSSTLYWVLGSIAALMILALLFLLTPARRVFVSTKSTEDKELASV